MAGHADLVLVGHRNHAVEEVGDALPERIGIDMAGLGQRRLRMGFCEFQVCNRVAAARHAPVRSTPRMLMLYLIDGSPPAHSFG